jgi:hypothetical protein
MKKFTLILAGFLLLFGSCTVQKRTYRPGFTVEWKGNKFQATETEEIEEGNLASTSIEKNEEKLGVSIHPIVLSKENEVVEPAVMNTTASSVEVVAIETQQEQALVPVAKQVSKKEKKDTQFNAGNAFEYKASIGADDGEGNGALTAIGWIFIIIGILILLFASILVGILLMLVGLLFFVVGKNN